MPLLRENSVIALRALASTTNTAHGRERAVLPAAGLGGSHTLRGYPSWRFRDRNRLLLTAEYRWTAGHFVDMALFVDAGKVAPRLADLDLRDFKKTYGLGLSFHTPASHAHAHRGGAHGRRHGPGLLVQPELLTRDIRPMRIFNQHNSLARLAGALVRRGGAARC